MASLSTYLCKWKFKLSITKTMSTAFHLCKKEARRELKIPVKDQTLPSCAEPTYLGIKLDRALTFGRHLESMRKKLTTRVGLLRQPLGSSWSTSATILRTATVTLVHSTAEYCAPAWCRSARFIGSPINDALAIETGCLHPAPTDSLFILAGIQPTELRRQKPFCLLLAAARRQNISSTKGLCCHLSGIFGNSNRGTRLFLQRWNY